MIRPALAAVALSSLYLAARATAAVAPAVSDIPPLAPALVHALQRAEQWRGERFLAWTSGGGMLLEVHTGRRILLERLVSATAKPAVLLSLERGIRRAVAPRVGDAVIYPQRRDGVTQWQLRAASGPARPLAPGQRIRGTPLWSAGGHRIAFLASAPGGTDAAVYIEHRVNAGVPRLVAGALSGRCRLLDWSASGDRLLLAREAGPDEQTLYTVRAKTGALTRLPLQPARILSAAFAPGGAAIYVICDQGSDYERLLRLAPGSGRVQRVSAPLPWDVERFAVSPDGRFVAYTVDVDGQSHLHVRDRQAQLDVAVPWLRDGVIENLHFDSGHRLGFTFQSSRQPPGAYVYDAEQRVMQRWRGGSPAPLGPLGPARARLVHFPTWDRVDGHWRMISADVYLPPGAGPAPVLIVLHAGVAGQFRPRWRPFLQFVVDRLGYAVIAPNVRGSSGYGRTFRTLVAGAHRQDAVRDIGSLMVWIGMQPGFDVHRIVLLGRGYGGWLAVNCLATFDGHLLGAVDIDGISSLDDYLTRASAAQRAYRRAEIGDPRDPSTASFLHRISPLGEVARIRSPLLIAQGLAGDAVRAADAQQLTYLLRFHNQTVELLSAPTAGRRFDEPAARRALEAASAQFLLALKAHRAK